MSIFVSSNDNNFYEKLCNEFDAACAKEPRVCHFIEFQPTGASIINTDDKLKWCTVTRRVYLGLEEELKRVNARFQQDPKNISSLVNLEVTLKTLKKVNNHPFLSSCSCCSLNDDQLKHNRKALSETIEEIKKTAFEILEKPHSNMNWKGVVGAELVNEALSAKKKELACSLIENGADFESEDALGWTAFLTACREGHVDLASNLIQKGIDVKKYGYSALFSAVENGHEGIVKLLIQHGVEVTIERSEVTLLAVACGNGHLEIVKTLLAHGAEDNLDIGGDDLDTPLIRAVRGGHIDIVKELLEHNADVNLPDGYPLIAAIQKKKVEIAKLLLANGANPHAEGYDDDISDNEYPALYIAIAKDLPIVEDLLNYGVNPNAKDKYTKKTPLHFACEHKNVGNIQALLANGAKLEANIKAKDRYGRTVLHYAAKTGCFQIVQELLQHADARALINSPDKNGDTPLTLACNSGHLEIYTALFACLFAQGIDKQTQAKITVKAFHNACDGGHESLIQWFLDQKLVNIHSEDEDGNTALHFAAERRSNKKSIGLLIANGADINRKNRAGQSALHAAFLTRCLRSDDETLELIDIVKELLEQGADINKQTPAGDTAVSLAITIKPVHGCDDVLKILLEKNIKESYFFKFKNGTTPIHELFQNPRLVHSSTLASLFLKLAQKFDITCKDRNGRTPLQNLSFQNRHFSDNVLKQIFHDFGAIETVVKSHGEKFLAYFRDHVRELIEHPKNSPTANPFALALLYNDRLLADKIALELSTEEFLKKCQELKLAYPKTPVLEFFFEAFISQPYANLQPLPEGHIKALFSYLRTQIDVTKSAAFQNTFRNLLSRNNPYSKAVLHEILGDFNTVEALIKNPARIHEPGFKISAVHMEIAFLFDRWLIPHQIVPHVTEKDFRAFAETLKQSYPKSPVKEFLFTIEHGFTRSHVTKGVKAIPKKPAGIEVRDLRTFFNKINFTNPQAPLYFDPKEHGLSSDPSVLSKVLDDFIEKVEKRIAYLGTPPKGTDALKEFYQIIENAVTNVIQKLKTVEDERYQARTIIDFLKDIALCGGKIFTISIEIFNRVVHGQDHNYENKVFSSLGELRSMIARDVIPQGPNNVHDYNKFIKAKGKKLGIPGYIEGEQYQDICLGTERYNPDSSEQKFHMLYTAQVVLKWLAPQFATDPTLREKYTAWWKLNAPQAWGKEKYDPIKQGLSQLKAEGATKAQIEEFLESHDIGQEDIEDARTHAFIEKEVYEDISKNTFRETYFIESLVKIGLLDKAKFKFVPESVQQA